MATGTFFPRGSSSIALAPAPSADTSGAIDAAQVQSLLDNATAGTRILLQPGTYTLNAPWVLKNGVTLEGAGKYDTIVKLANSINADGVLISEEWAGGNDYSDVPVSIRRLTVDANGSNNTGGNHGIILMSYWSTVEDVQVKNCDGSGLMVSATESDASEISNTLVETRIRNCDFRTITTNGIYIRDDSNTDATVTDGWVENCVFQNIDGHAIQCDSAAGWVFKGNHFYGVKKSAIKLSRAWETKVLGNYCETWGTSATVGTYGFVEASTGFTTGTLIISDNNAFHAGGIQTGVSVRGIIVTTGSSTTSNVVITDNVLRGATHSTVTYGIRVTNNAASSVTNLLERSNIVSGWDYQKGYNVNGGTLNRLAIENRLPSTPTDVVRENIEERGVGLTNVSPLSSGRLYLEAVWYDAGETVTTISWCSMTTSGSGLTHRWAALFNASRQKVAISADDTSATWTGSVEQAFTMTTPYVIPTAGWYYHGLCVVGSTVPTFKGFSSYAATVGKTPIMGGYADSSLTDPASCPSTAAALTSLALRVWTCSK